MRVIHLTIFFILSVTVYVIEATPRALQSGFYYSPIIGFVLYFLLTYCSLRWVSGKQNSVPTMLAILLALVLLELSVRIPNFAATLVSLPDVLSNVLGVLCGYLCFRVFRKLSYFVVSLGLISTFLLSWVGYDYWLHLLNFGSFTGRTVATPIPATFVVFDESGVRITGPDLANKITVLDFWHTRCGVCFEKFPQLQLAYDGYQHNSKVMVLAVDKPIEEDEPGEAFRVIRERGFTFPVVIPEDEHLPEKLGVIFYPTTFVIDSDLRIIYKGDLRGALLLADSLSSRMN